jgi:hypothetical protein
LHPAGAKASANARATEAHTPGVAETHLNLCGAMYKPYNPIGFIPQFSSHHPSVILRLSFGSLEVKHINFLGKTEG